MPSLYDISQTILSLNKEHKFSEALTYFKENKSQFTNEQIWTNKFLVSYIVSALIELGNYDQIFDFLKAYNTSIDAKSFSFMLKRIKDKVSLNWEFVNKFCNLISPDQLDGNDCITIEVERKWVKKPMELASSKENRYAIKTKALLEIQQYEECFNLSKKALESFKKFHYSNDIWFARRIALSKKGLGNPEDALNELLHILDRKKEWFIQSEVAEIYKEKGDIDSAFQYAMDAINNFGDIEYKVGLLVSIAELLIKKGEQELAFKHYLLSKLIRQEEERKVPENLSNIIDKSSFNQTSINDLPKLKAELKKYWNTFKKAVEKSSSEDSDYIIWNVSQILNNNDKWINWFISYQGQKVYFSENRPDIKSKINIWTQLKFTLKILPDGKTKANIKGII